MSLDEALRLRPVRRLAYTVALAELEGWSYDWNSGEMTRKTNA